MRRPNPRYCVSCGKEIPWVKGCKDYYKKMTCGAQLCKALIRKKAKRGLRADINKKTCPQCKKIYSRTSNKFCSVKCRDTYNKQIEKEERLEAANYLLSLAGQPSGPVKIYTPEEIEAIKHQITPIEQIPRRRYPYI